MQTELDTVILHSETLHSESPHSESLNSDAVTQTEDSDSGSKRIPTVIIDSNRIILFGLTTLCTAILTVSIPLVFMERSLQAESEQIAVEPDLAADSADLEIKIVARD